MYEDDDGGGGGGDDDDDDDISWLEIICAPRVTRHQTVITYSFANTSC
jgi:hypothetical protein